MTPVTRAPRYEYRGRSLTLSQWEAVTGIRADTIRARLKCGWTLAEALMAPLKGNRKGSISKRGAAFNFAALEVTDTEQEGTE